MMNATIMRTGKIATSASVMQQGPAITKLSSRFTSNNSNSVPERLSTSGAGTGNVHDQMLPAVDGNELFRHTKYPRTVSIIGYVRIDVIYDVINVVDGVQHSY
jgi:hypothetical protein